NGAGKSTLLKIITGVLTPTSGSVHVHGRIASLLELGAGFNPEYTGVENIYFQGSLMGYTHTETEAKIESILQFADIGDFVHQPVKTYSSGMFARLAFAIVINVDPDILIVDEALSVGDVNFQAKCMTAMERIKQKGTTIFFVSHDLGSVKSLCQKGIYIKNGVLHSIGNASDVADMYTKEMREELNKEHKSVEILETFKNNNKIINEDTPVFKTSEEFANKVAEFRYGTGEAKVTFVEVLDIDGQPVVEAKFNQEIIVKIYVECHAKTNIAIAFELFDDKRINLASASFQDLGEQQLTVENGDRYIATYRLKLPLQNNVYSLQTYVTNSIIEEINILYYDVIPNAYIFQMARRPNATLWSKVYLFPTLNITRTQ
ncbi:MAG: ABC transporter ATP-binding protein, partial [Ignavibacteria bacterium]|nr:ABC transporter ATP-binding protein [Ignavibacteria bacterium]